MQVVIDIPEQLYNLIQDKLDFNGDLDKYKVKSLMLAVDNGTPLPKGHGRLIDESTIDWLGNKDDRFTLEKRLANTSQTIIEADKEE